MLQLKVCFKGSVSMDEWQISQFRSVASSGLPMGKDKALLEGVREQDPNLRALSCVLEVLVSLSRALREADETLGVKIRIFAIPPPC